MLQSDFVKSFKRHRRVKLKLSSAEVILILWNVNKTATNFPPFVGWLGFFGQRKEDGKSGDESKTRRNNILLKVSFVKVFLLGLSLTIAITSNFPHESEGKGSACSY